MIKGLIVLVLIAGLIVPTFVQAAEQTQIILPAIADNYVDSKYPKLGRYGSSSALYVGNSYDRAQNIWGSERIYIRFNLTQIPQGSVILSATLRLWQYYAPTTNQTYEAHRVLANWNETTQNWESQTSWDRAVTSTAIGPSGTEVAVEWDITKDVRAWYSGQAPNYGTMIKVAKEERVQDASSGFWSRHYPVEKWKPRLVVLLGRDPSRVYVVKLRAVGLPAELTSQITVDGQPYEEPLRGETDITFDKGTSHTITVAQLVAGPPGTRYTCQLNQANVSSAGSYLFVYTKECLIEFVKDPSDLFETPPTGWYAVNATLSIRRIGPNLAEAGPGTRYLFDGWYVNGIKMSQEPETVTVTGPVKIEGHYRTEYYLNVTSPIGKTKGSGWYTKDSVASFSVDRNTAAASGLMGALGVKLIFSRWVGSNNFLALPVQTQGQLVMKEPTKIEAIWEEDWGMVTTAASLLLVVVVFCIAILVTHRRRRSRRLQSR